ncbi:MAG: FtsQ-type POTRA domain-containing protein [Gemmatimonadota bacterium]|nr:FtsQ-type POTRA domain-containing protein [Gemmatimonadota bacterium]
MTRTTRRRLRVAAAGALLGVTAPLWGPRVLRGIPVFEVTSVEVEGARFVPEDEIRGRAAIDSAASVWDDAGPWERRVESHPLVDEARVRRRGPGRLAIQVREVRPVALAATPELLPVDEDGRVLEIDPARHGLDLPILAEAELEPGGRRLHDEAQRRALAALEELRVVDPEFPGRVSEIRVADAESLELLLVDGSRVERLVLPLRGPALAFRRAAAAIRAVEARGPVETADARFAGQVVIRPRSGP